MIDEGPQEGVRRDDLIEHLYLLVLLEELLPPRRITEVLDQGVDVLVVEVPLDEPEVGRSLRLHLLLEEHLQELEILDDRIDLFAIESEGFFQLVEDPDEIEDEAMGLHHLLRLILIGPVHPGDRLEQGVIPHRLVEIHGIEHGCVESREQLLRDDQDLRLLVELPEALADLPLLLRIEVELLQQRRVVVIPRIDHLGVFRREHLIESMLVEGAGLAIHTDQEGLVPQRLHILRVVLGNEPCHLLDPLLPLEEVLQIHCTLQDLVQLLDVRHPLGLSEGEELLLQRFVGDEQLIGGQLVVERKGSPILDAVGDGVFVEVALIILTPEGLEGPSPIDRLVHRGSGEADEGGIGETRHEEVPEIPRRRPMSLVDQDIDILPQIQIRRHIAELMDHRHDDASVVVAQELIEPGDAVGVFEITQAERREVLEHLVLQLIPVDH